MGSIGHVVSMLFFFVLLSFIFVPVVYRYNLRLMLKKFSNDFKEIDIDFMTYKVVLIVYFLPILIKMIINTNAFDHLIFAFIVMALFLYHWKRLVLQTDKTKLKIVLSIYLTIVPFLTLLIAFFLVLILL